MWLGALLRVSRAALYTNAWAVRIRAGEEAAERIAEKHGLTNLGQVGGERERLGRSEIPAVAKFRRFSPRKLETRNSCFPPRQGA